MNGGPSETVSWREPIFAAKQTHDSFTQLVEARRQSDFYAGDRLIAGRLVPALFSAAPGGG